MCLQQSAATGQGREKTGTSRAMRLVQEPAARNMTAARARRVLEGSSQLGHFRVKELGRSLQGNLCNIPKPITHCFHQCVNHNSTRTSSFAPHASETTAIQHRLPCTCQGSCSGLHSPGSARPMTPAAARRAPR